LTPLLSRFPGWALVSWSRTVLLDNELPTFQLNWGSSVGTGSYIPQLWFFHLITSTFFFLPGCGITRLLSACFPLPRRRTLSFALRSEVFWGLYSILSSLVDEFFTILLILAFYLIPSHAFLDLEAQDGQV
jgi:hypothetical protein